MTQQTAEMTPQQALQIVTQLAGQAKLEFNDSEVRRNAFQVLMTLVNSVVDVEDVVATEEETDDE